MIWLIIDVCCYFQVWINFSLNQSRIWWCYWWDELICWSLVEMCWSGLVETNYQVTSFSVVTRAELRLTWGCTRALAAMGAAPATARSAGGRVVSSRGLHTRGLMDMRSSLCSVILRCIISDISQHHSSSSSSDTEYCQQINIVTANITHFSHSCLLRPGGENIYSGILMVDENFTLNC